MTRYHKTYAQEMQERAMPDPRTEPEAFEKWIADESERELEAEAVQRGLKRTEHTPAAQRELEQAALEGKQQ